MSPYELFEIRRAVHQEITEIEQMCAHHGTYRYLVEIGGLAMLSHQRVGRVLRSLH